MLHGIDMMSKILKLKGITMKKILWVTLLVTGLMAADSGFYIGAEYGASKNSTTIDYSNHFITSHSFERDNNYKDIKVKMGAGTDGGFKYQATVSFISYDENLFTFSNEQITEYGFEIIKELQAITSIYPFIKVGFGINYMDSGMYDEEKTRGVAYNIGAGFSYKATDHIYLLAGVDYIHRQWQDIHISSFNETRRREDSAVKPYIGMNYRFLNYSQFKEK